MATKTEVYVDTSALIAVLDRSDTYHGLFRRLFSSPPSLVASSLVISEGHGWFLRRYDQNRAIQFLNFIDTLSVLEIKRFDRGELAKTALLIKKFRDQPISLADGHGLVLINERRISFCWSTDRHLGLTGAKLATTFGIV
jgi:predicted nucleic acid-binding protein